MCINKKKKLFLSIFAIAFIILIINLRCEWPWGKFKRNSNLSLFLTADFDSAFFLSSFFLPRFSQDGGVICSATLKSRHF